MQEQGRKQYPALITGLCLVALGAVLNKFTLESLFPAGINSTRLNLLIIAMELVLAGIGLFLVIRRPRLHVSGANLLLVFAGVVAALNLHRGHD